MERVVVITGGSSGIGLAAARLFAQRGCRVYELSRSGRGGEGAVHFTADLSDEESVREAFAEIGRREDRIDVLINNAGFGISGAAEQAPLEEVRRLFDVNFFGALACIQCALPLLRAARGKIINISSAAAVFAIPFQAFYSASKAAVNLLTLALANELRPFGVGVCAVMLGDVRTGFTAARKKSGGDGLYEEAAAAAVAVMERDEQSGMSPGTIAAALWNIAGRKRLKPLYTVGLQYRLFLFLNRLLPTGAANRIVGSMYRGKKTK